LAMLSGRLKMGRAGDLARGVTVAGSTEGPAFKTDANAPFAHPYFWAPFVLIGNWK